MKPISRLSIGTALLAAALFAATAAQAQKPKGKEYTGKNRIVSFTIPQAPNFAGVPYKITALDTKGDRKYDKVMLHVDDFGQYVVVGARIMPAPAVAEMDQDEPGLVLRNLSEATLMGWRTELGELPDVIEESFVESKHGNAIVRVYRAKKGSILLRAQGRTPTADDAFDTNIFSIVARRGPVVVFVISQDDSSPDNTIGVMKLAQPLFDGLEVAH